MNNILIQSQNYRAHMLNRLKPERARAYACNRRSHRKEKPIHNNQRKAHAVEDPAQPKINKQVQILKINK